MSVPNEPSKLEPHREFIAAERRKKTTYRRIAQLLLTEKGLKVDYSTIHAFVKVRSKPPGKVITMLEPTDDEVLDRPQISKAAAETARPKTRPERPGQLDAIQRLTEAKPARQSADNGLPSFKDGAPLERLSEEEARRLRDEL